MFSIPGLRRPSRQTPVQTGLFCRLDWPALVITTLGASLMRLLGFMAVGTLCQSRAGQKIVGPSLILPHFGMSTLWIRHAILLILACRANNGSEAGRILGAFGPEIYRQTEIETLLTRLVLLHCNLKHEPRRNTRNICPNCQVGLKTTLLLFEPVLLQTRQGSQSRVGGMRFALALFMVQIRATAGA
jgi:hypothetical protein